MDKLNVHKFTWIYYWLKDYIRMRMLHAQCPMNFVKITKKAITLLCKRELCHSKNPWLEEHKYQYTIKKIKEMILANYLMEKIAW